MRVHRAQQPYVLRMRVPRTEWFEKFFLMISVLFLLALVVGCSVSDPLVSRTAVNCSVDYYDAGNQDFGAVTVADLGEVIQLPDLLMTILKHDHEELGALLQTLGEESFQNSDEYDDFVQEHALLWFPDQPGPPSSLRVCFIDAMHEGDQIRRFTQAAHSSTAEGVALYRESRIVAVYYLSIITVD